MSVDENKSYDGIHYSPNDRPPLVFKILCAVLLVWGLGFMGHYLFGGWTSAGEYAKAKSDKEARLAAQQLKGVAPQAAQPVAKNKEEYLAIGKQEFAARCASCHGESAKGGIGPDLTAGKYKYGKGEAEITQSITEGRPGGMPSFKNDLSHEKVEGLVKYLMSL